MTSLTFLVLFSRLTLLFIPASGSEFSHPELGAHVFLFDPGMPMDRMQMLIDSVFALQSSRGSEFTRDRFALLFSPGTYQLDVRVGYYMQVLGLGESPEDVVIEGAVRSNSRRGRGHVLTNFWRSVENLTIVPQGDSANVWGVSQASPMRRVHVHGDLQLHDNGYASGGFMADSKIDGIILAGGQQQWFSRNCQWSAWRGGAWNIMSMGVIGAPETNWPDGPCTTLESVPVSREKPYLVQTGKELVLRIPDSRMHSTGLSWPGEEIRGHDIHLKDLYIVRPGKDNAASINRALEKGMDLLFTPGIYSLETALRVTHPGTVVAGLGMPSLVPLNGNPALEVSDVGGVLISGLLFDAGLKPSGSLLKVGDKEEGEDHSEDPLWLFDLFFRIGGPGEGSVTSAAVINSNDVFIDHIWLWRADHGNGVGWDLNRCASGIVVNGDRVTVYGLFNEHNQEYQTLWNGESGRVYLYQSEMPYDPPTVESWMNGEKGGYASYKVGDRVLSHQAWGVGVYCVFHHAPVVVYDAIETPEALEDSIHHKFTFWLGGFENSSIESIINGKGEKAYRGNRKATMD